MERAFAWPVAAEREPISVVKVEVSPKTLLWILLLVACVWVAFALTSVLLVVTVALVLVGTIDPLVGWLERRGFGRGRALVLVFLALAVALCGALLLTIPPLVSQLLDLIGDAPAARDRLIGDLSGRAWTKPVVQLVQSIPVEDIAGHAGDALIGYSTAVFALIGYGLSTLFLAIYLLADPVRAKGLLYACVPRQHHIKLARILLELKVIVGGYMRGQLITSAAISAFVFLLLTILGVDNALPLALFAGMTDVIPFIGGYIASAPVIIAVIGHGTPTVIGVSALMLVYQEFESRILVPRVYGRVLRLQPAIVLVALLVGGTLMGILGALLALPIAAGVQMVIRELRVDLPGEATGHDEERARDRKVEDLYEQLAEGAPATQAAAIAGQLAETVKAQDGDDESAAAGEPDPAPAR
ncbi:MAG TPA: AI-2E family transporter [Kofleriaceae bacterium]